MGDLVAHDLDPLVGREQRALAVIAGDPDDQPVDDMQGPANDVGMAIGDRVEGTGVDPDATAHLFSPSPSPPPSDAALPGDVPGASAASPLGPSPLGPSPLDPSPFSSATSGSLATETTRSPSPTLKTTTPWLPRRAMRMSLTGTRITVAASVTSMIWSLCPTGKTATTASWRRLKSML